ncbi:hypothetical protein Pcinc_019847 [Petrolisthes cinctipes]|uniref:TFIIS central domain-containing protein n=1 Tax=Petrolisthes cinctipes TaxID=88211 RepID=A0AAE1FJA8_PETCI|nr:hypothetical protein Pcinc_019847 [Petrolisthes cinctipes]
MGCEEEVLKIKKKLDKMTASEPLRMRNSGGSSCLLSLPSSAPPTMLSNALKMSEIPDGVVDTPESLAEKIEEAIYQEFRNTDAAYKNRLRSRVYNLRALKTHNYGRMY